MGTAVNYIPPTQVLVLIQTRPLACFARGLVMPDSITPANPLPYLLVIVDICIATYPQCVNSTNSNAHLGFSYPWV